MPAVVDQDVERLRRREVTRDPVQVRVVPLYRLTVPAHGGRGGPAVVRRQAAVPGAGTTRSVLSPLVPSPSRSCGPTSNSRGRGHRHVVGAPDLLSVQTHPGDGIRAVRREEGARWRRLIEVERRLVFPVGLIHPGARAPLRSDERVRRRSRAPEVQVHVDGNAGRPLRRVAGCPAAATLQLAIPPGEAQRATRGLQGDPIAARTARHAAPPVYGTRQSRRRDLPEGGGVRFDSRRKPAL